MRNILFKSLKLVTVFLLIGFLYAFSAHRNNARKISRVGVEFIEEQNPYVDETAVNKLLIQNQGSATSVGKEILALNAVERQLDSHTMIQHSDVYLTVNGELKARIKQRTPIARVNAVTPFYIDVTGKTMPLSKSYAAHVPLIYNVSEKEVIEVFPLLKLIQEDLFLKKHVTEIFRNTKGEYELKLRVYSFLLVFGKIENIESKIRNFKAFYQKAQKDKSLEEYKKVSLQFSNQVVCTKK